MDQRTKQALWIIAGVVFVAALIAHHNITQREIIIFCCIVPSIILHELSHGLVANAFGDDTMQQKMMISLCVMLWCATSAMRTTAPAAIHRARFVRSSIGRLPDGAPGGRT